MFSKQYADNNLNQSIKYQRNLSSSVEIFAISISFLSNVFALLLWKYEKNDCFLFPIGYVCLKNVKIWQRQQNEIHSKYKFCHFSQF